MVDQVVVFSIVEILVGMIAASVAYFAWGYREQSTGMPLFIMATMIAAWALANGLHSLVPDPTATTIFSYMTYPFVLSGVIAWFYVAVEYTDQTRLQHRGVLALFVLLVLFDVLVIATNPIHNLFMTAEAGVSERGYFIEAPGPLYWIHVGFAFTITLAGVGLFGRAFWRARGIYRKQTAAIIGGAAVAVGFALVQVFFPEFLPALSLNMVGMTFLCGTLLWTIFVADFFETVPLARELLIENMDDAVVALNSRDRVVDANPIAMQLLDIDEQAIGSASAEAFESYPELVDEFENTYDAETKVEIRREGETRHYDITISPVKPNTTGEVAADRVLGRIIVIRDITEQVRRQNKLEEQKETLEAQKQTLERQNERLDRFASVISHDLRNPLNTAAGYLDVALETGDEEHFEKVAQSHERMETMIKELLTMARAETQIDETEPVSLARLTTDAWGVAETGEATLETDISEGWTVEADRSLLQNILENLFRNAADHNDPPLTVRVGTTESGFYIEDDGEGIPADERKEIFEHGYTTESDGTGFGLSIVSELADAHGWSISVTEGIDGGARFEIRTET